MNTADRNATLRSVGVREGVLLSAITYRLGLDRKVVSARLSELLVEDTIEIDPTNGGFRLRPPSKRKRA